MKGCPGVRALLYAYPHDFRQRYGGEMAQVFATAATISPKRKTFAVGFASVSKSGLTG